MAGDWETQHTFAAADVLLATYFEALRQNYFHIRKPRYAVAYGKGGTLTITGGAGVRAWSAISDTYIDPITIESSGRDLLIAANPISQVSTATGTGSQHIFGVQIDGVNYYSSTHGLSLHNAESAIDITVPLFAIIPAPTVGEHEIVLFASATHGIAATSTFMKFPGSVFLAAMEI